MFRHLYLFLLCLQKLVRYEQRRPELRQRIEPDRVDDNADIVASFPFLLKQRRGARLVHLRQSHNRQQVKNSHTQSTIPNYTKASDAATLHYYAIFTAATQAAWCCSGSGAPYLGPGGGLEEGEALLLVSVPLQL